MAQIFSSFFFVVILKGKINVVMNSCFVGLFDYRNKSITMYDEIFHFLPEFNFTVCARYFNLIFEFYVTQFL